MADTDFTNSVTLTDAAWFDETNTHVYGRLTGVTGTNTIAATAPSTYSAHTSTPLLRFIPAYTNTSSVTMTLTPSGGSALSTVALFAWGAALAGGELRANAPAIAMYDGTQYNLLNPSPRVVSSSLAGDVALSTTSAFFTGPSLSQATTGLWWVSGKVTFVDPAGAAAMLAKLWDGTSVIDSGVQSTPAAGLNAAIALSGYILNPAGDLRISVKDASSTNGVIKFNSSGESKDSTITAMRIG